MRDSFGEIERHGKWVGRVAIGIIAFAVLLLVAYYTLIGFGIFKLASSVSEHGLRSVIERVWCGEEEC